jgi:PIN domain nuclease of toxin-antitoxin system
MRILIDSHTFYWWAENKSQLSPLAREILADPETKAVLSLATLWELSLKHDRLKMSDDFDRLLDLIDSELGAVLLPVELTHIRRSATLPWHHRDPFDRILIAQALVENLSILTVDSKIARYQVPVIW